MTSTTLHRTFRFRLEPTAVQERTLRQFAGARRWVWNWALAEMQRHYKETGQTLPASVLSARLSARLSPRSAPTHSERVPWAQGSELARPLRARVESS